MFESTNTIEDTKLSPIGESIEGIIDANAFTINEIPVMHMPVKAEGVTVTAACGQVAYCDYFNVYPNDFAGNDITTHQASWASGYGDATSCPECAEAYPNW